jgi:hypothetical protein
MRVRRRSLTVASPESGYALLLVVFFVALLVLSVAAVTPTALSVAQREKEKEMIWRGQEYARGVRLYYTKMRRFPTALDDLTKPKTGIRFMRKAYKDPMNQVDGSWRLIYVGPSGQLIGSLNQYTIGSSGASGSLGIAGGSSIVSSPSSDSSLSTASSPFSQGTVRTANSMNTSLFSSNQPGGSGQTPSLTAAGNANGTVDSSSTNNTDQGQLIGGSMDSSNTVGGNIIGVGSKVNKNSFMVYQRATNYRLFEFVWDPSKGIITTGNSSVGVGTPVQSLNDSGIAPAGTNTSDNPFTPGKNPTGNPVRDPLQNQNPPQN